MQPYGFSTCQFHSTSSKVQALMFNMCHLMAGWINPSTDIRSENRPHYDPAINYHGLRCSLPPSEYANLEQRISGPSRKLRDDKRLSHSHPRRYIIDGQCDRPITIRMCKRISPSLEEDGLSKPSPSQPFWQTTLHFAQVQLRKSNWRSWAANLFV